MVRSPIGNKLSAFVPPPLPEALPLPPLPQIHDRILYERAITHTSVLQVAKNTHDLDVEHYAEINDYEKLEYVGDRILSMCVDLVVHEVYPHMRQGVATMVHSNLVRNETLSQLADRYGITDQIKTSREIQHVKNELVKVKGSAFEAWVASVFFDYQMRGSPERGPQLPASPACSSAPETASSPTSESTEKSQANKAPSTATDQPPDLGQNVSTSVDVSSTGSTALATSLDPTSGPRSFGEAMDHVFSWLKPLYLPILDFILKEMRNYQVQIARDEAASAVKQAEASKVASPEAEEEHAAGGALLALNVLCEKRHHIQPIWRDERARPGIWRLTCDLTLPDGQRFIKSGEKPTKKLAKAMAALEMCRALKVLKKKKSEANEELEPSSQD